MVSKHYMVSPQKRHSRGCFSKVLGLVLWIGAIGLVTAVYFITQPQDLSDIAGRKVGRQVPSRDLKVVLKNALDRGYPVTLSEAELNQWLRRVVQAKQGGLLKDRVEMKGVWVRLEEGRAEVVMERTVWNRPFTVSMYLRVDRKEGRVYMDGGPYHERLPMPLMGGRFGRLVVPQGFLILVMPAYQNMAALFGDEFHLGLQEMASVRFERDRLVLDPRLETETEQSPGSRGDR